MMNSHDLQGFANWEKWPPPTHLKAPNAKGIYVFRLAEGRTFGRLEGESDLIYIGATHAGKQTVLSRLKQHATPRPDEKDIGILLIRLTTAGKLLEISWRTFESDFLAQLHEGMLLHQYERDHLELPPLNSSRPMKRIAWAINVLKTLPQETKDSVLMSIRAKQVAQSSS
jgi:hypothetical protein